MSCLTFNPCNNNPIICRVCGCHVRNHDREAFRPPPNPDYDDEARQRDQDEIDKANDLAEDRRKR